MLDDLTTCSDLAAALTQWRGELETRAGEMGGLELMHAYSDLADELLCRVYDVAVAETEAAHPTLPSPAGEGKKGVRSASRHVAIAAVGGYGRREMSPFSDVDVAFIVGTEADEAVELVVKRAFRLMMDTLEQAGLKVGYSYRRADDVENLELETQTALLDARCVAGSPVVFGTFASALRRAIVPAAFVTGHIEARLNGSSHGTPFVVEPNVKEGRGGLRDLHAARWLGQIALGLSGDAVWDGLRARGILLDREIEASLEAAGFVSTVRNALHLITGRGLDVLSLDRHHEVAARLGFATAEEFISRYYAHAHNLWRVCRKVGEACLRVELAIEPGMVASDGRLRILDPGLLQRDPAALLRVFRHAQSYRLQIAPDTQDAIVAAVSGYETTPDARATFLDILSSPGAASALRSMAEMGVLEAVVPQFGELMYLIPGDAAHGFTVGEHSLRAVEELEQLLAEDREQFSDVFSRVQSFDVLFLAALMHDIGKLDSKRDHAKTGAFRATKLAAELGMSEEASRKVEFLVRNHLKMAETARVRDLNQPKTVRDFVAVVDDPQLLDMLFLLTMADYRAVGTAHWSQVQIRFLSELHERAAAAIRSPEAARPDIERHRSRVRRELRLANLPEEEIAEHCESMPASYLLNTPPEDLAAHIGYVRAVRQGSPAVDLKDDRGGQFSLLTVVAADRPGLLSDVAGVLHALGVDIHVAQVFTRQSSDKIAIDTLYIDFEGRQLSEMKKRQVEGELANVLSGELTVDDLLRRWRKEPFILRGDLSVRTLENLPDHQTVVEIRTPDTPGLLHYLTRKLSEQGFDIHSARIATWGHEARDVFYVGGAEGRHIDALMQNAE